MATSETLDGRVALRSRSASCVFSTCGNPSRKLGDVGMEHMVENTTGTLSMDRFNAALRQVLSVSKADLNRLIAADKASKVDKAKLGPKPKKSPNQEIPAL
jgi:hypothetical protein